MERQGVDLETKIEELEYINQTLREKDKMKEDGIANLSGKLIMLSERLDAVEGKKSNSIKLLINKQYYIKCVLCSLY